MELLSVLQIVFDAVLLFGILFLFHYSVHQSQKKREESDILKDLKIEEMRENLQDLLLTLKQLGKEVSENIQEQVKVAEDKTEKIKKVSTKLEKDLTKLVKLSEDLELETDQLEKKSRLIDLGKSRFGEILGAVPGDHGFIPTEKKVPGPRRSPRGRRDRKGFPTGDAQYSTSIMNEVYRMAAEEYDLAKIASATKLSRAEIQLILNLKGNRFSTPN